MRLAYSIPSAPTPPDYLYYAHKQNLTARVKLYQTGILTQAWCFLAPPTLPHDASFCPFPLTLTEVLCLFFLYVIYR